MNADERDVATVAAASRHLRLPYLPSPTTITVYGRRNQTCFNALYKQLVGLTIPSLAQTATFEALSQKCPLCGVIHR